MTPSLSAALSVKEFCSFSFVSESAGPLNAKVRSGKSSTGKEKLVCYYARHKKRNKLLQNISKPIYLNI